MRSFVYLMTIFVTISILDWLWTRRNHVRKNTEREMKAAPLAHAAPPSSFSLAASLLLALPSSTGTLAYSPFALILSSHLSTAQRSIYKRQFEEKTSLKLKTRWKFAIVWLLTLLHQPCDIVTDISLQRERLSTDLLNEIKFLQKKAINDGKSIFPKKKTFCFKFHSW